MGLPNNVRAAMAIEGRTREFVRRLHGKCGCRRGSSMGLWLTCLTFDPKCTGTFWAVSTGLWLMCLTFDPKCIGTFWVPNNVWVAMAIKGCACWGAGQWCKPFNVTMVTSPSSLDDVLLMGVGSKAGS
jgi:hypothetical protein